MLKNKLFIKYGMLFYFIVIFYVFLVSFQSNKFGLCDVKHFENFAMGTEAFVLNRIALTEKFGNEAFHGMVGRIPELDDIKKAKVKLYRGRSKLDNYYSKFIGYLELNNFKPYYSNMAIQGVFLAWLNDNKVPRGVNFNNYRLIFSILSAFILLGFVYWVSSSFGFLISIFVSIIIIQLDWIVASSSHLFWFTGLMFLPFVCNLFLLKWKQPFNIKFIVCLGLLNVILTLIKCLTSGFEVIPTFLVMNTLPVFFYWVKNDWKLFKTISIFSLISFSSICGLGLSMTYQALKINAITNSSDKGIKHLKSSFLRRSVAKIRPNMPDRIKKSYTVSRIEVVKKYLPSEVISFKVFNSYFRVKAIDMIKALLFFLVISIGLRIRIKDVFSKKYWAILIMTLVSLIGPLSMFTVFKSLSYLHPHLVPIVWSLPFAILLSITACMFITDIYKFISNMINRNKGISYTQNQS